MAAAVAREHGIAADMAGARFFFVFVFVFVFVVLFLFLFFFFVVVELRHGWGKSMFNA